MIRRVHREILRELTKNFAMVLGTLMALVLAARLVQLRELLLGEALGMTQFAQLLLYLSPFLAMELLPVCAMLAVFLTFLRMASEREMLALKAHGISLAKLLPAVVFFLAFLTAADFALGAYGLSWGARGFKATAVDLAQTQARVLLRPGEFITELKGVVFHADVIDQDTGLMERIFVEDTRDGDRPMVAVAPRGTLLLSSGSLSGMMLNNGTLYRYTDGETSTLHFERYLITISAEGLRGQDVLESAEPKEMSLATLSQLRADPELASGRGDGFLRRVDMEFMRRFAVPVACLALGLLAVPLASALTGAKQVVVLLLGLGLFLGYYVLLAAGATLIELGMVPPWLGVWIPNAAAMAVASWALYLAHHEKSPLPQWLFAAPPAAAKDAS